jgi:hypothetical protein
MQCIRDDVDERAPEDLPNTYILRATTALEASLRSITARCIRDSEDKIALKYLPNNYILRATNGFGSLPIHKTLKYVTESHTR